MNEIQGASFKNIIVPVDGNGTTLTTNAFDTTGPSGWNRYWFATIIFAVGNIAGDMTALKLTECDTSGGSYADVSGGDFSANLPLGTGGDNGLWVWQVNLLPRKRFFKVTGTCAAAATLCCCIGILTRGENLAIDNTERNLKGYALI